MSNKTPTIIGISGGSASGKSTLCSYIEKSLKDLKVYSLHLDDYYKSTRPTITAPFTKIVYKDFNHPNSIDFERMLEDFNVLKQKDIDVLLIEGIFALYKDEIIEHLDLKIYVDCQSDERLIRRIKRNLQWGESFDEITSVYLDAVRYRHNEFVEPSRWHADIILNGSSSSEKGTSVIIEWIKNKVTMGRLCNE